MMLRYTTLAILLVLVIGSGWLLNSKPESEKRKDTRDLSDGYYLLDATISDTNDTGKQIYSLNAARIDHIPGDGSVQLTDLKVIYNGDAADPWTIEAERGAMRASRDRLNLRGGVTISSRDSETDRSTTISTEQLTLDITNSQARTDKLVRINISGGELNAMGMEADLIAKKIDLLADVRGSFGNTP